jgi:hypothetical protein
MEMQALKSEEDVRTKVVVPWLLANGFSLATLSLEFSFRIRLGRSIVHVGGGATSREPTPSSAGAYTTYSSRADVLVRNENRENLLIVEVKAPGETLDDQARDQGISYARCIAEGNIAPYVVLTNGLSTRVFDSHSRAEIFVDDAGLSTTCNNRSRYVTSDDLSLRAEALESLISFSPKNLIAFCEAQSRFRMKPLFGEKIDSDKKFIPSLFIEREEVKARLAEFIDDKKHRVTLLIGHPQVGKTNFVCQTVLERLTNGHPCLFYPAIGLNRSLLEEIANDFEWSFAGVSDTFSHLIRKINNVLQRANTKLTIFIDGWNETNIQLARTIDSDCSRLLSDHIQVVISLTHNSATRLLKDAGGNSSFLAEEAGISSQGPSLIELDPESAAKTSGWNCIHVKNYSPSERDRAYEVYASAYQVAISLSHQKTPDPYVLGIAMKQYSGGRLPDLLDEPVLLNRFLLSKISRSVGLENHNVPICLRELGREMIRNGTPVPIEVLSRIWSLPLIQNIPNGFFESALLAMENDADGKPSVDFYYGRERDYVIACMAQEWPQKLAGQLDMEMEFSTAARSRAGIAALSWFLRQPAHVALLQKLSGGIPTYKSPQVRQTLLASLCEYSSSHDEADPELLKFALSCAMNDKDNLVRIEAVKLVVLTSDESDDLVSALRNGSSLHDFIEVILGIGEEFPFKEETSGRVVLDALRSLHWDNSKDSDEDETSEITDVLINLSEHPVAYVRREANTCLGYVAPFVFVANLSAQIEQQCIDIRQENFKEFAEGIKIAAQGLGESYYGDICPGSLEAIYEDPDYQAAEYRTMMKRLGPIIRTFGDITGTNMFKSILKDLRHNSEETESTGTTEGHFFVDIHTLPLPFEDKGK